MFVIHALLKPLPSKRIERKHSSKSPQSLLLITPFYLVLNFYENIYPVFYHDPFEPCGLCC